MEVKELLAVMVERDASDVYLTVASPPMFRIEGVVQPMGDGKLAPKDLETLARSIMTEEKWQKFIEHMEMDLALSYPGLGRFRANLFRQRGSVGLVIRNIKLEIKSCDELALPPILKDISMTRQGLVLVVGRTGSGKSTTLAAIIDHRNSNEAGHIISIEDPIEFVHKHKKSIVNQRELGFDTHSFHDALKNAMRQAPDVILIGEIRDAETMEAAINLADTGHLCLGTLHSTNSNQSFDRILNFFSADRHPQMLMHLSLNLRAIIAQRLIPSSDGKRVAALEVLMDTPRIKDLIKKGEFDALKEAMEQGIQEGCQTFDRALFALYREGKITIEQALMNADSANNLRLKIKMDGFKGNDTATKFPDAKGKKQGFRIKSEHSTGSEFTKI
ncbi:MAG: PilT/PilU family type 4a pilus ATPase [Candidatus Binatia bacterium]